MDPQISIIVPHYNTFDKLKRLLNSIPFKDKTLEVIVVDDKSEDRMKFEEVRKEFEKVQFYINDRKNKGAGAARNVGLDKARGKWLLFADADDFFLEGAFEVIAKYLKSQSDIVHFMSTSIYEETKEKAERHLYYNNLIKNYIEKKDEKIRYRYGAPWGKLIKRNVIVKKNIAFEEIVASNDINFSLWLGYYAKKIKATSEEVYCVTRSKGSLTTNLSKEVFISRYKARKRHTDFLKSKKKSKYQESMYNYILKSLKYGIFISFKVLSDVIKNNYRIYPESALKCFKSPKDLYKKLKKKIKVYYREKRYYINH